MSKGSTIGFLLFYTMFLSMVYLVWYMGSPTIFSSGLGSLESGNYTYSNDTISLSKLEMFFNTATDYYWINIMLLTPMLLIIVWIIISWLRGITPS